MSMLCAFGLHRARPMARWNGGYYFSTCARCGKDLVRTPFESWHIVPPGYRVVWSPTPPPRTLRADLAAAATARPAPTRAPVSEHEVAPAGPGGAFTAASPSELDAAARDSDLPIAEVLRLLREDEQREPAEPDIATAGSRGDASPGVAAEDSDLLALANAPPALDEHATPGASTGPEAALVSSTSFTDGFEDDFMAEGSDREFWSAPAVEPLSETPPALTTEEIAPPTAEPAAPDATVEPEIPDVPEHAEVEKLDEPPVEPAAEAPPSEEPQPESAPAIEPEAGEPVADVLDPVAAVEPEVAAEAEAEADARPATEAVAAAEPEAEREGALPLEARTEAPEAETEALELSASAEIAALADPSPPLPKIAEPEAQVPPEASVAPPTSLLLTTTEPVPTSPAPTRNKAAWPSAAPTQERARIVGMDDAPRGSAHIGLAVAGALLLGAAAVFLFTRVPHPEPSGPLSAGQRVAHPSAPAIIGQPAYVTVRLLSCRASSVLQAHTVRILSRGDRVQVLAREPGWASVMKDGRQCWVVDRYVSSIPPL